MRARHSLGGDGSTTCNHHTCRVNPHRPHVDSVGCGCVLAVHIVRLDDEPNPMINNENREKPDWLDDINYG